MSEGLFCRTLAFLPLAHDSVDFIQERANRRQGMPQTSGKLQKLKETSLSVSFARVKQRLCPIKGPLICSSTS